MSTIFRFNWLRESAVGHLEADISRVVRSEDLELAIIGLLPEQQAGRVWGEVGLEDVLTPRRLPVWAQRKIHNFFGDSPTRDRLTLVEGFCNRIRDRAWNLDETEIFMPYFGRREWIGKFAEFPEIEFVRTPDGITAKGVNPQSLRELALRAAASAYTQTTPASPLVYRCRLPLIAPYRNLLLDRYGLDLPVDAPALDSLTVTGAGNLLAAWQNTPRERHCHYYNVFSRLALAVQYLLRRWTLAAYALGPEELADFDVGGDVLVYSATRPHAEKRTRDFSYDVLDSDMMDYAFSRGSRRLEPILSCVAADLLNAGREEDARMYLRRDVRVHAPRLTQRARKRSRVRAMLVSESVLIYAMIRFANRLKTLDSPRTMAAAVDEMMSDFDERVRRLFFFVPQEVPALKSLLFIESSNAIHQAMGGEASLEAECQTIDGALYQRVRPMGESLAPLSSTPFRENGPLVTMET